MKGPRMTAIIDESSALANLLHGVLREIASSSDTLAFVKTGMLTLSDVCHT